MSGGEAAFLVFIISAFMVFGVMLGWLSHH